MLDRALSRIANWAERNSQAVSYASFASTILTGAIYARFISIPEIPYVSEQMLFWASIGWNGLWWGYIHGAIQERRQALQADNETTPTPGQRED